MNMRSRVTALSPGALAVFLLSVATAALGCSTPVAYYALERWEPDAYLVAVFYRGELSVEATALAARLEAAAPNGDGAVANVVVKRLDLNAAGAEVEALATVCKIGKTTPLPYVAVIAPRPDQATPDTPAPCVWSGRLDADAVTRILDSPGRQRIVARQQAGDAVVWAFLPGGDKARDEAARARLQAAVSKISNAQGPAETVAAEELAPGMIRERTTCTFSIVDIKATAPAECVFVAMLLNTEEDLHEYVGEPMAFPIFGRGRALFALVGRGITEAHIADASAFLSGPCSCQVKALNPGVDLLVAADWERVSGTGGYAAAEPEETVPELTGLAPTPVTDTTAAAAVVADVMAAPAPSPTHAGPPAAPPASLPADAPIMGGSLLRNVVGALAAAAAVIAVVSRLLRRQRGSV